MSKSDDELKRRADPATRLREAIAYVVSPDFPKPNTPQHRLMWLTHWWAGEKMRMERGA